MKKQILFLLLFVSSFGIAQSINDYKVVVVPLKFEFIKTENQYRLSTLSKFNLNKAGFEVYYSNQDMPSNVGRCEVLNYNIEKDSGFLTTKLFVTFKDCYGKIVYQSEVGVSREKEFQLAYTDALNKAFASIYELGYQYNGGVKTEPATAAVATKEVEKQAAPAVPVAKNTVKAETATTSTTAPATDQLLYAQPLTGGNFQLIDSKPSVVMKIFKTSDKNSFLAQKGNQQGVLINKDNQWYFEYYQNENLVSEKINVKF